MCICIIKKIKVVIESIFNYLSFYKKVFNYLALLYEMYSLYKIIVAQAKFNEVHKIPQVVLPIAKASYVIER